MNKIQYMDQKKKHEYIKMKRRNRLIRLNQWHKASGWELLLNLILQPQSNVTFWIQYYQYHRHHSIRCRALRNIPAELNKKMEDICIKIASGYCASYEEESLKIVPIPLKQLIGTVYLFEKPSIFRAAVDSDKEDGVKWESEYIVRRSEDGKIQDINAHPTTNSLLLQSVASTSDTEIGEIVD